MPVSKTYTVSFTVTLDERDAELFERLDKRHANGALARQAAYASLQSLSYNGYQGAWRGILASHGFTYSKGYNTDHLNDDPGDNRFENLKIVTTSQNHKKKNKADYPKSSYNGVSWNRHKWQAFVSVPDGSGLLKRRQVRSTGFETEMEAALAYDALIDQYKLDKPKNFPK